LTTTIEDVMYEMAMEERYREEYEQELIDIAVKELPEENIRSYLGRYGDAIEKRVNKCKKDAAKLLKSRHYGLALVSAVTAIEIISKYFILRPLFEGALLTDKLTAIFLKRVLPREVSRCCELLPSVAKHWKIPLSDLKLSDGNNLWDTLKKDILPKRNAVVHKADELPGKCALIAIDCIDVLMKEVMNPMAKKFRLSRFETGVWHKYVYKNNRGVTAYGSYKPSDPFK